VESRVRVSATTRSWEIFGGGSMLGRGLGDPAVRLARPAQPGMPWQAFVSWVEGNIEVVLEWSTLLHGRSSLAAAPEDDRSKMAYGNAKRLLKL
jgi:hypothetical protein